MNNPDNQHTIIRIAGGVARHPLWRMAEPINLEVKQGEQIAIVGDNAAGKTRLVEVLTGHYPLLMNEVQNYPVDERVVLADAVLQTLNPVDPAVQEKWLEVADRRP